MKIKNIFLQKNFLIPAILLVVIASVATIVVLSSDSLDSNLLKNKQVAQVGSTCIPNPNTILQNGDFESLTAIAEAPYYTLSYNFKEVCFFEGEFGVSVYDQDLLDPLSNNILKMRYTRHSGEGIETSPWFNSHQSQGTVQYVGDIPLGTYDISLKAKLQNSRPIDVYIGFSDEPILINNVSTQDCSLTTGLLPATTVQATKKDMFETCVLGQFGAYTNISVTSQTLQTYTGSVAIEDTGLRYMYFLPLGTASQWYVPPGETWKPSGQLTVDDITFKNQVCASPAATVASQAYGSMYYNQNGQVVSWGVGNSILLSQTDSQPLTWSQYNSLASSVNGQGVVFQRPSEGTFVVTPLAPYTNYTLQDIQQMFSFSNVSITGMETAYNANGPFVLRKSNLAQMLLPKQVLANIDIPHYIVSYECGLGATNPSSPQSLSADISVVKSFLDNVTSSTDRQIKYLVRIKNNSSTTGATGVVVKDLLPSGITYSSHAFDGSVGATYTPSTGLITVPFLSAGGSINLTITASAPLTTCGSKTNTATLQSLNQTDSNSSNNSSSATLSVVCLTTKTPTSTKK